MLSSLRVSVVCAAAFLFLCALPVLCTGRGVSSSALWGDPNADPPTGPVPFNNIGHTGRGYDIYKGNPHATIGVDPGVRDHIFTMASYDQAQHPLSADGRFIKPKFVEAFQDVSCRLDFTSQLITSEAAYANNLAVSVSVGASGEWAGSFSASADYKYAAQGMQGGSSLFVKTMAECAAYTVHLPAVATMNATAMPELSPTFQEAVRAMNAAASDKNTLQRLVAAFVANFGTHFFRRITMGSRYGQQNKVNTVTSSNQTTHALKLGASYSAMASLSASIMTEGQMEAANKFSQTATEQQLFTLGSVPPTDGDAKTWAHETSTSPSPLRRKQAVIIADLLTPAIFPNFTAIATVQASVRDFLASGQYCHNISAACASGAKRAPAVSTDNCFGGLYVTNTGRDNYNIFTGKFNCPAGYTSLGSGADRECFSSKPENCVVLGPNGEAVTSYGGTFSKDSQSGACSRNNLHTELNCACPSDYIEHKITRSSYTTSYCFWNSTTSLFGGLAGGNVWNYWTHSWDCPDGYRPVGLSSTGLFAVCIMPGNDLWDTAPDWTPRKGARMTSETSNTDLRSHDRHDEL